MFAAKEEKEKKGFLGRKSADIDDGIHGEKNTKLAHEATMVHTHLLRPSSFTGHLRSFSPKNPEKKKKQGSFCK